RGRLRSRGARGKAMSRGRRQRLRLFALLLGLIPAGCHRLPFHRVDPTIDPRDLGAKSGDTRTGLLAETDRRNRAVPLPPLPLRPVSDHEALSGPGAIAAEPTPLLDAALARAQYLQDAAVESAAPAVLNEDQQSFPPPTPAAAQPEAAP